jgi:hypothetical protein
MLGAPAGLAVGLRAATRLAQELQAKVTPAASALIVMPAAVAVVLGLLVLLAHRKVAVTAASGFSLLLPAQPLITLAAAGVVGTLTLTADQADQAAAEAAAGSILLTQPQAQQILAAAAEVTPLLLHRVTPGWRAVQVL